MKLVNVSGWQSLKMELFTRFLNIHITSLLKYFSKNILFFKEFLKYSVNLCFSRTLVGFKCYKWGREEEWMTASLHYISGGKKKGKTQDKETPTTRQSLLLYTTPLFTLHSKSLHVPSNQFTARHFIMSAKQKTKQKKKQNKIFAGFQPLPHS